MKYIQLLIGVIILTLGCSVLSQSKNILTYSRTIELPNVEGRIDHMSIDIKSNRLFIAALGNNSIEVVDLKSGKDIHSITGLKEPQGVYYYSKKDLLFVASAGDGTCKVFNASNFKLLKVIQLGIDADNIRYDKKRKIVFVGFGLGGIATIDPVKIKLLYNVNLPSHPESFQIDETKGLLFVNVPDAGQIDVIDIIKRRVIKRINLDLRGNFPMALDTLHHVIFVGSRKPPKLIVFDESPLRMILEKNISSDADDIFYDSSLSLIFVSCGSGNINIFKLTNSNGIILKKSIETLPGARTSLYVPELNKFFLAARSNNGKNARIIEYLINS